MVGHALLDVSDGGEEVAAWDLVPGEVVYVEDCWRSRDVIGEGWVVGGEGVVVEVRCGEILRRERDDKRCDVSDHG